MLDPQIQIGRNVKHEDEIWEIITIDLSSDLVQLIHKTAKITCWVHIEKLNLVPIYGS